MTKDATENDGQAAAENVQAGRAAARTSGIGQWLAVDQPRLGAIGTVILVLISNLVTPLALDMYTPAIPQMVGALNTTEGLVNLTLVGFFGANAIGLLLFGTVSDKYGRKRVLIAGTLAYSLGSFLCAVSFTIEMLIVLRIVSALGAGAVSAVGTAIVKDAIKPEYRDRVLAVVQVMFVVGPVLAPLVGAVILQFFDWHGVFVGLGIAGLFIFLMALAYKETLPATERTTDNVLQTIGHLSRFFKNKGFTSFLLVTSLLDCAFMGYIAVGAYVYEDFFGLSEMGYSLFFAASSLLSSAGPIIYLVVSRHISIARLTTLLFAFAGVMGVLLLLIGHLSPFVFCILIVLFCMTQGIMRPYSMNLLLAQEANDAGAASSVMNFVHTIIGMVGMIVAVGVWWPTFITSVGTLIVVMAVLALVSWMYILKKPILVKGINAPLDE